MHPTPLHKSYRKLSLDTFWFVGINVGESIPDNRNIFRSILIKLMKNSNKISNEGMGKASSKKQKMNNEHDDRSTFEVHSRVKKHQGFNITCS
jgi:hypothetical protein